MTPQGEVAAAHDLCGMPTTVFIAADGRIAGGHTGQLTEGHLRTALDTLRDSFCTHRTG